jgi:hypothetical protein
MITITLLLLVCQITSKVFFLITVRVTDSFAGAAADAASTRDSSVDFHGTSIRDGFCARPSTAHAVSTVSYVA